MQNSTPDTEYSTIQSFSKKLFLGMGELSEAVSASEQAESLEKLIQGRRPEQFFFIIDLPNTKMLRAVGTAELGYDDKTFSFRQYLRCLANRGLLQSTRLLSERLFEMQQQMPVQFLREQFIANIPMRHANGQVWLVKRSITPWQHTETGLLTAYLSEFTILKPYEGEPMNPRFTGVSETSLAKFYQLVEQFFTKPESTQKTPFSPRELDVLRAYAATASNGKRPTANQIAEQTNATPLTVKDHNKKILTKAKELFGEDFQAETAFDVAVFLKKNGLLQ